MSDATNEPGSSDATVDAKKRRSFPASTFEDALEFAKEIWKHSGANPIRRLTLFHEMERKPESGPSRQLITNAGRYQLIVGSYQSAEISLSEKGVDAVGDESSPSDRARAKMQLAILDHPTFESLYRKFVDQRLPSVSVLADAVKDLGEAENFVDECVSTFISNLKFVGLLQTLSGAERILTVDHALDEFRRSAPEQDRAPQRPRKGSDATPPVPLTDSESGTVQDIDVCFYLTPIGEEDSPQRKHSDLFLSSLVEPAVEKFGLRVVRADQIDEPGLVTQQIIDYLHRAKLVIADLSFHNPNVFYELVVRHTFGKPCVMISRARDPIPFDLKDMRTIRIDDTDIYTLVPALESIRADIANHVRSALAAGETQNPLSE